MSASVVKVGVLGALVTATIAVPVATAAASTTGVGDVLPAALPQTASAEQAPVQTLDTSVAAVSTTVDLPSVTGGSINADALSMTATGAVAADGYDIAAETSAEGYTKPVDASITSDYGWRIHPVLGYKKLHNGIDYGVACGTSVHAAQAGVVTKAEFNSASGYRLEIDHGNGVTTGYFHLQEFTVSVGDTVEQGQVVALSGNTGRSTGCHLHFSKIDSSTGEYSDPMSLFQ